MVWYEELGFDENPFEINPMNRDDEMIGRESIRDDLLYRIQSGSMVLIIGKEGVGKTMLLKSVVDNHKGKIIYIDGKKVSKRLNIENLIMKGSGWVSGLLKKRPKGMILLLDDVHRLSLKNNKKIKFYFDQGYLLSVVFTSSDYGSIQFTESMKDRIGKRVIKLRELPLDEVIQVVKNRIEGNSILPEEIISEIYAVSGKNVATLLKNCALVCEYAVDNGDEIVKREHIGKAIGKEEGTEEETETCYECGEELISIKTNWICPHCDTYCTNCGGFVLEEDARCPTCEVEFLEEDKDD